jgi:hypothetical protein
MQHSREYGKQGAHLILTPRATGLPKTNIPCFIDFRRKRLIRKVESWRASTFEYLFIHFFTQFFSRQWMLVSIVQSIRRKCIWWMRMDCRPRWKCESKNFSIRTILYFRHKFTRSRESSINISSICTRLITVSHRIFKKKKSRFSFIEIQIRLEKIFFQIQEIRFP